MTTKKKTEEVTEVEVKEEKTTTKKSTSTKKTTSAKKAEPEVKVEEPVVEEVKVEEPAPVVEPAPESVVEPIVEEKPEVKVEKPAKVEKKEESAKIEVKKVETTDKSGTPFTVEVITPIGIYTKTAPSMDAPASKVMPFKSKLAVVDQKGNWGRLTNGKWILLSENLVRKI